MSRDLTLVRLDVNWVPAERIAEALPGVSPDDLPEELRRSKSVGSPFPEETWTGGPEGRPRRRPGERAARLGEPTEDDPMTERYAGATAARVRKGSTSDDRRHRRHSGETPPPGVPSPHAESSDSGGKSKLLLLGGAAVAVLGALAAAAGFLWKKKSGGKKDGGKKKSGGESSKSGIKEKIPVIGGSDGDGDEAEREPRTERGHTSAAPIVGMTALAVMAAFVRRFLPWPRGR